MTDNQSRLGRSSHVEIIATSPPHAARRDGRGYAGAFAARRRRVDTGRRRRGGAPGVPTAPPPVTILSPMAAVGHGDIFITPTGDTEHLRQRPRDPRPRRQRRVVSRRSRGSDGARTSGPRPTTASRSSPGGRAPGFGGLSSGTDYIYNDHYQQIATVNAGNGLSADGHEFLITPWNTALILSYTTATANLTSIGGAADQTVINGVVQEIDIATGKVLFQWNSADHVPFSQSEQPLPASAEHPVGLVPHQRRQARHRRQHADRRPRHVDDV